MKIRLYLVITNIQTNYEEITNDPCLVPEFKPISTILSLF